MDEFRALAKCERAMASVGFSANAQPAGFWLGAAGTRMHAEADLFQPPRLTLRRLRSGVPPLMTMLDGLAESESSIVWRCRWAVEKTAGTSTYDGLPEFVSQTYRALERNEAPPVSLDEIEVVARMVADFTNPELML